MIHLSLNELNLIAKSRSIKDYKEKSEQTSVEEVFIIQKQKKSFQKRLYNLKYYDNNTKYQGIRDIGNLFGEVHEDYYKPIKTKSALNGNQQ